VAELTTCTSTASIATSHVICYQAIYLTASSVPAEILPKVSIGELMGVVFSSCVEFIADLSC